ncbi:MAG TPA: sulfite exporter TauE/SafE family protein [Candidatus Dormibacteraeota bacterium]|nr:sulfite exporter TauE/SafE family protein [Candidatus Dormibacteraeota bacterium]
MSLAAIAAVALAGFAAGAINAIVGSGSLITFPTLLAVGFPPVVANVSNTLGIFVGTVGSVFGYRRELAGQRARILQLLVPALGGGTLGAALLLVLPQRAFKAVVPVLIAVAVVLVVVQPWLTRHLGPHFTGPLAQRVLLPVAVFLTAIYGGYFGAAQGVILMGIFLVLIDDSVQRLNGLKNVCASVTNLVAAVYFVLFARIAWEPALVIAVSSLAGSQLGSVLGRRLPPNLVRVVIVVAGVAGLVKVLA